MSNMKRHTLINVALIAGLFILGGLCGLGARKWIGGLGVQHAQLERCTLNSKHAHPSEDARSALAHLDVEVPACMHAAGYDRALDNKSCSPAYWQGDLFCYVPRSYLGKLIYRMEAASYRKKMEDGSNSGMQAEPPLRQMPQSHEARPKVTERW